MTVEWSVSIGNIFTSIATVFGFLVGALGFFFGLRSEITRLGDRMGAVEKELSKLTDVLVELAQHEARQDAQEARMDRIQRQLDVILAKRME